MAAVAVLLLLWLFGGSGKLRNVCYERQRIDFLFYRGLEVKEAHDVDVLFLGSSHAYRTFDPRTYTARGLRVFNLGFSNQTPVQTELLLQCFLDTLRPRLVVFEVHPDIMAHDGIEATLGMLGNFPPTWPMMKMALATRNARVICTALYGIPRNMVRSAQTKEWPPAEFVGNRYVPGGYVECDVQHYSPQPHDSATIVPLPSQLEALERCLSLLRQRGIPCLLLEVPDTKVLMDSYTNLDEFQRLMSQYGEFHFKAMDCLDDSLHFYNDNHLNQLGVDLYGPWVCDSLIVPILNRL